MTEQELEQLKDQAGFHLDQGQFAEAEPILLRIATDQERQFGPQNIELIEAWA